MGLGGGGGFSCGSCIESFGGVWGEESCEELGDLSFELGSATLYLPDLSDSFAFSRLELR